MRRVSRGSAPPALVAAALAAALAGPAATAPPTLVVYRCVGTDGSVLLQNDRRCPKGMREERRVLERPTASVAPVIAPAVPSPPAPEPHVPPPPAAAPAVDSPPSPAPALFACRTWEGTRYFGDTDLPAPRCAPLETVGLDRRTPSTAQACELRMDECEAVPEGARCEAWAERLREAETTARFGDPAAATAAASELERLRVRLAGSVCLRSPG